MAGPDLEPYVERKRTFRRAWLAWVTSGAVIVFFSAAYNGSALHTLAEERMGARPANAVTFLAGLAGVMLLLWSALILCEHTAVSEAAVEQIGLGHRPRRFLWKDVDRVTLYKSARRGKGPIEIRTTEARTLRLDPHLKGFDLLEEAVLERAEFFGIEVNDQRD